MALGEARYDLGERRPDQAEWLWGRVGTELPAQSNPRAPVCCGKAREGRRGMRGMRVKQTRSYPWREDHTERVSDRAGSLGLLRNDQKAEEHLDALVWSLQK